VVSDEGYFPLQSKCAAHIFRQNQPALPVGSPVLGARMQVAQKNPAFPRRNRVVTFRERAHPGKLLGRHDEKKLVLRLGQKNKFLAPVSAPAGRNRDTILFVDGVTEFAGEESLWLSGIVHAPADSCAISIHFPPLLTTLRAKGQ
jgi:hypothetical protein